MAWTIPAPLIRIPFDASALDDRSVSIADERSHSAVSEHSSFTGDDLAAADHHAVKEMIQKIYDYRKTRRELHRDEKILVSWNGLMISALAEASTALSRPEFLDAAKKADRFIMENLTDEKGRLHTAFAGGRAAARLFTKLAAMTGKEIWRIRRNRQLSYLAGTAQRHASSHCEALQSMLCVLYPSTELLCVASEKSAEAKTAFQEAAGLNLPPNTALLFKYADNQQQLAGLVPFTADYPLPRAGIR